MQPPEQTNPPAIAPPPAMSPRPFWSVMIPTYNPNPSYLRATLEGVLQQDPGREAMQICVVDDASSDCDVRELTSKIGGDRVDYFARRNNGGLALCWNSAIERASGEWVHLLHQDDLVLPGAYSILRAAVEGRPQLGAAYVQHYLIDDNGEKRALICRNKATHAGIVENWLEMVFEQLSFQTPAIVVKRDAFEVLGGFLTDFRYALDWDMWKRIAAAYPVWYDPRPLAAYRRHSNATSINFLRSGENVAERRRSIELSLTYLPEDLRKPLRAKALAHHAADAVDAGLNGLFSRRDLSIMRAQWGEAWRCTTLSRLIYLSLERFFAASRRWAAGRRFSAPSGP